MSREKENAERHRRNIGSIVWFLLCIAAGGAILRIDVIFNAFGSLGVLCVACCMIVLVFSLVFVSCSSAYKQEMARVDAIKKFVDGVSEISANEYLETRAMMPSVTGVYIIHNKAKNMYYVGQGQNVKARLTAHFLGHGNGDVYADFKYGDEFTIKILKLAGSGYDSLDALERDMIAVHDAFRSGYNRTRGNGVSG